MEMDTNYTIWIEVADADRATEACRQLQDLDARTEEDRALNPQRRVIAFTATADDEQDAMERGYRAVKRLSDDGIDAHVQRVAHAT
jgi:hypothetical protein